MAEVPSLQTCILIADDFEPFRRFTIAILHARLEWQIIAEHPTDYKQFKRPSN